MSIDYILRGLLYGDIIEFNYKIFKKERIHTFAVKRVIGFAKLPEQRNKGLAFGPAVTF